MPITNLEPSVHPAQPSISFDLLAIDEMNIRNGAAIDAPASIEVFLRPYAEVETLSDPPETAYITAPNISLQTFVIPDVYTWARERAEAGDMLPMQVLAGLTQAVGEEYERRRAAQP